MEEAKKRVKIFSERQSYNVSSDGDSGLSGDGEGEVGLGGKDGVRHLLHRGEGQHGTQQPTTLGTPTGRTPTGSLGTQLWTCGVPASEGVSLSQCRCFCQRFHLAMCAVGPICHRRVAGLKTMLLIKNLQQKWQTNSLLL